MKASHAKLAGTVWPPLLGVAYFVTALGALSLTMGEDGIAAVWLASGLLPAGLLLVEPAQRRWLLLWVGAGSLAANLIVEGQWLTSAAFTAANLAEGCFAAWLIRSGPSSNRSFATPRRLLWFVATMVVAASASAIIAAILSGDFHQQFVLSWASTVLFGLLTVIPPIMLLAEDYPRARRAGLTGIVPVLSLVTGLTLVTFAQPDLPLLWLPMAAVGVATYTLGLSGTAISLLIVTVISGGLSMAGIGPVGGSESMGGQQVLFLQFYLMGLLASVLPLAALLARHQATVEALAAAHKLAAREAMEVRHLAETDQLTGIANRRKIINQLREEVARTLAFGSDMAVVMMDLDHFKRVNDVFGHASGDLALRLIVRLCREHITPDARFGRLGGEEFLLVLPGHDADSAAQLANMLREAVHAEDWASHGLGEITLSLGVAAHRGTWDDADLLRAADEALYSAKRSGRDCVRIAA